MGFLNELFSAGVWGKKTPTAPKWKKWIHRNLSDNHCPECLKLNDKGQRLSIKIEIARKDTGDKVSFITGWMVYPNGHIQLTTPLGCK